MFVSKGIAVKLKEKGYKEKCFAYYGKDEYELYLNSYPLFGATYLKCCRSYNSNPGDPFTGTFIDAPTIPQVLKWLREEKQLFLEPYLFKGGYEPFIQSTIFEEDKDYTDMWRVEGFHPTYEEAAIAGIEYVIDNLI